MRRDNLSKQGNKSAGNVSLPMLFLIPVLMFGFGYLMVPIYNVLCDITGLNGKTGRATIEEAASLTADTERLVKVEFTGSLNNYAPWSFTPNVTSMMVSPGKQYTATYNATNQLDRVLTGQAVPSVAPGRAAKHFKKTECFCFTAQKFEAEESRDMPLVFVVDPDLPQDVDTVTLSYTFFDVTPVASVNSTTSLTSTN